jgi:hypothetical protein
MDKQQTIDQILNKFKERFPDEVIKVREGPKKKVKGQWVEQLFQYIPTDHLHERLDEVCGLFWTWEILGNTIITVTKNIKEKVYKNPDADRYDLVDKQKTVEQVIVWGRLSILLPGLETPINREAFGGCDVSYGSQAGDSFKIADSNAFKKACYKFGIGRYLGLEGLEDEITTPVVAKVANSNPFKGNKAKEGIPTKAPNIFKGTTGNNPFKK